MLCEAKSICIERSLHIGHENRVLYIKDISIDIIAFHLCSRQEVSQKAVLKPSNLIFGKSRLCVFVY